MQKSPSSLSLSQILRGNGYLIGICLLIAGISAFFYLRFTTEVYEASATVELAMPAGSPDKETTYGNGTDRHGKEALALLRSPAIVKKALETAGTGISYFRNGSHRESPTSEVPFSITCTGSENGFRTCSFSLRLAGVGQFRISPSEAGDFKPINGAFGEEFNTAGLRFRVEAEDNNNTTASGKGDSWTIVITSPEEYHRQMNSETYRVEDIEGAGRMFRISFRHTLPEKAMQLVNSVTAVYIDEQQHRASSSAAEELAGIDEQITISGATREAARDSLNRFRAEADIVDLTQSTAMAFRKLGELESRQTDLENSLYVLEKTCDRIRLNRQVDATAFVHLIDPAFAQGVDQARLSDNETSRAAVLGGLTETRRKLLLEKDRLAASIRHQKGMMSGLPARETALQELTRNYELQEQVYRTLVERRTAAMVDRQLASVKHRVMEAAVLPLVPVYPDPFSVWGLALSAGMFIGITAGYLRQRYRRAVQTPEDLRSSSIPVIGQINRFSDNATAYRDFTALSTRILMNNPDRKSWVITVTSSRKGEGKSFISTQLARTLAAQDLKVILLDLNTHDPRLGQWFEARTGNGIREVYTHQCSLQDAIQLTSIPSLDVITAGASEQAISHLISGKRTREIIDELRSQYDVVVIDTPEVGEFVDAIPYMKWSDMNLYVVRADSGKEELLANAELVKEEYRLEEIYFVLNAMQEKRNHTGYLRPMKNRTSAKRNPLPQLTGLF